MLIIDFIFDNFSILLDYEPFRVVAYFIVALFALFVSKSLLIINN